MSNVYAWVTKLLLHRQLRFEKGNIILMNEKMFMVPVNFFINLTKRYINEDKDKLLDLYLDAWIAGLSIVKTLITNYNLKKYEERYRISMDALALAGIGDYKTIEFIPGQYSHFQVFNNPLALAFYPCNAPVDHWLRGANAGGGTLVHEKIINCIEIDCAAVNGYYCEFLNATKEVLEKKIDKKHLSSQLDLDYLIEEEKRILDNLGIKFEK